MGEGGEGEDEVRNNLPNHDNEVSKVLKGDLKTGAGTRWSFMASTSTLQTVLCAHLVLQGMGPAFEIDLSQKVEVHLQTESVDPPLHSPGLTTR